MENPQDIPPDAISNHGLAQLESTEFPLPDIRWISRRKIKITRSHLYMATITILFFLFLFVFHHMVKMYQAPGFRRATTSITNPTPGTLSDKGSPREPLAQGRLIKKPAPQKTINSPPAQVMVGPGVTKSAPLPGKPLVLSVAVKTESRPIKPQEPNISVKRLRSTR